MIRNRKTVNRVMVVLSILVVISMIVLLFGQSSLY